MTETVIIALITGSVSVLINILTLIGILYMNRNVNKTHEAVNSKMTELLTITASAAKAEGRLEK